MVSRARTQITRSSPGESATDLQARAPLIDVRTRRTWVRVLCLRPETGAADEQRVVLSQDMYVPGTWPASRAKCELTFAWRQPGSAASEAASSVVKCTNAACGALVGKDAAGTGKCPVCGTLLKALRRA